MKQPNVVLATTATTYTNTDLLRVKLAREMFEDAEKRNYVICCVERTKGIIEEVLFGKVFANVVRISSAYTTTGEDRRRAIEAAMQMAGHDGFWAWVEPERVDFPKTIPDLVMPLQQMEADVVVPERSEDCWKQLRPTQWMSEKAINQVWEIVTGTKLDVAAGPKIGNYRAGQYFLRYRSSCGDFWDSTVCPLQFMIADGLKVVSRKWNFLYPLEQIEGEPETEQRRQKRLVQFTNLAQSIHYCSLTLRKQCNRSLD